MKVVHLITGLGTGGAERMLQRLVCHPSDNSIHHVVVSMLGDGALGESIREKGVRVHGLGMSRGYPSFSAMKRLVKILKEEQPDILQTWLYHADLMGSIVAYLAKIKIVVWNIRCSDMDMQNYSLLSRMMVPLLARLSGFPKTIIVNSVAGKALHQSVGYHPANWQVIPNGFDLSIFEPKEKNKGWLHDDLGLGPSCKLVGHVARFDPMKDHLGFLRAAAEILKERTDVHFVMVGNGITTVNGELADEIKRLDIGSHIHLLGERRDVPKILGQLSVMVSSSAYGEGFSNVLGEAMAAHVPCVATDVGDAGQIIGPTGKIVAPKDPDAIAGAVLATLDKTGELGAAAHDRIKELYSLERVVREYEETYQSLVAAAQ